MITVLQAQERILKRTRVLATRRVCVERALGCVLARDVKAPVALPVMDNSAMDGFALRSSDTRGAAPDSPCVLKITGTLRAGDSAGAALRRGHAVRIMTGAPLPRGADAILPVEEARVVGGLLHVDRAVAPGSHVRRKGEEIRKGGLVLRKGSVIHPGTIAALTSLGLAEVDVIPKPSVAVIATGSELVRPGRPLGPGKVYDCNSHTMAAALRQMGIEPAMRVTIRDSRARIRQRIRRAIRQCDVVVLTGGVSVGDYDYVKAMLALEGARQVFWKVGQKPGKPLYFGVKGRALIFGLPGNPAGAYVCFYEYVYPALRRMSGCLRPRLMSRRMALGAPVRPDPGRVCFLKAKTRSSRRGSSAAPLTGQGSHMVASLHDADSLLRIPPGDALRRTGDAVEVHLLPWAGAGGGS